MSELLICPSCLGACNVLVHVNRGDDPHTWEELPCHTCGGTGKVGPERIEARRLGKEIRAARFHGRYRDLVELEQLTGLGVVELSGAEHGRLAVERTREILESVQRAVAEGRGGTT